MNFFAYRYGRCSVEDSDFDESKVRRTPKGEGGGQFAKKPETLAKEDARDILNKGESRSPDSAALDEEYMDAVKSWDLQKCAEMVRDAATRSFGKLSPFVKESDSSAPRLFRESLAGLNLGDIGRKFTMKGGWHGMMSDNIKPSDMVNDINDGHSEGSAYLYVGLKNPLHLLEGYDLPDDWANERKKRETEVSKFCDEMEKAGIKLDRGLVRRNYLTHEPPKIKDLVEEVEPDTFLSAMKNLGYDGLVDTDNDFVYAFDQTSIKSAEPVTYGDDGNVIPLSKRFDMTNPDTRY